MTLYSRINSFRWRWVNSSFVPSLGSDSDGKCLPFQRAFQFIFVFFVAIEAKFKDVFVAIGQEVRCLFLWRNGSLLLSEQIRFLFSGSHPCRSRVNKIHFHQRPVLEQARAVDVDDVGVAAVAQPKENLAFL